MYNHSPGQRESGSRIRIWLPADDRTRTTTYQLKGVIHVMPRITMHLPDNHHKEIPIAHAMSGTTIPIGNNEYASQQPRPIVTSTGCHVWVGVRHNVLQN